jgi:hypothetical protein
MATDDDMRERLQSLETKFDRLEKKVDQLPTKADLSGFATKADLSGFATKADLSGFATKADLSGFATKADLSGFATKADLAGFATKADLSGFATKADLAAFTDAITDKMGIMLGDAKDSVKKAAEGYGGTLERIERELNEFRSEWRNKSDDTDRVLADHLNRIVALEQ